MYSECIKLKHCYSGNKTTIPWFYQSRQDQTENFNMGSYYLLDEHTNRLENKHHINEDITTNLACAFLFQHVVQKFSCIMDIYNK